MRYSLCAGVTIVHCWSVCLHSEPCLSMGLLVRKKGFVYVLCLQTPLPKYTATLSCVELCSASPVIRLLTEFSDMNHIFAKCGSIAFGLRGELQRVRCQFAAALRVAVVLPLQPLRRVCRVMAVASCVAVVHKADEPSPHRVRLQWCMM